MTTAHDPAGGPVEEIVVIYAGPDVVWARWLVQTAQDAGVRATGFVVRPGMSLLGRAADLARAGTTVVPVVTRNLVAAARPAEGWTSTLRHAEEHSLPLLAVMVGETMLPAEAGDLDAVDLRQLNAAATRLRFLSALRVSPEHRQPTVPLSRATVPDVRFPGRRPKQPPLRVPEPSAEWFFGRESELDELRRELAEGCQAVLSGPPGSGKSWLAAEYLRRYGSQYDIVAWVRAGSSAMLREDLGRMCALLGVPDTVDPSRRHLAVTEALRHTTERCLLVLDDAVPDGHMRALNEALVPGEKPAKLRELFPSGGPAHVVYTTHSSDWDGEAPIIKVPGFDADEGADFLTARVPAVTRADAVRLTKSVDGSPSLLHSIAQAMADGLTTPREQLDLLSSDLVAAAVPVSPGTGYSPRWETVCTMQTGLLKDHPDDDARHALTLLRLLTFFAAEPVPLDLLTARMEEDNPTRLPAYLPKGFAEALRPGPHRGQVLGYIRQFSLAYHGMDHDNASRTVLGMHRLIHDAIRVLMNREEVESGQHIVHQLLVDADPKHSRDPGNWRRYLQLWRQLVPSGALECDQVRPGGSCAELPMLISHIVQALREKGELTAAAELGQEAARGWQEMLADDPAVLVMLEIETAAALWQLNRIEEALATARSAQAGALAAREWNPISWVRATNLVAAGMRLQGDWAESVSYDREAYQVSCNDLGEDNIASIRAGHNLAGAYHVMGDYPKALELDVATYRRCLGNPGLGDRHTLTLHSLNRIAQDRRALGDYAGALGMQRKTLEELTDVVGDPLQQHVLRARKNLAVSLRKAGHLDEALALAREVYRDHLEILGPKHYESIAATTNLANDLRLAGAHGEALEHAESAYSNSQQNRASHPFTAACAVNLAAVLRCLGRVADARALDEEALALFTEKLGEDHRYTLSARAGLAYDKALAGDVEGAIAEGRRALERFADTSGSEHPYTLQCAVNLSIDLRSAGFGPQADELEAQTLAAYDRTLETTLEAGHPDAAAARERRKGDCDVEPPTM